MNTDINKFSKEYVIKKADEIRNKYSKYFPINSVDVANNLGFSVFTYNESNNNVSSIFDPQQKRIFINKNDGLLTQKFATCNAIGHWILDYECQVSSTDMPRYFYRNLLTKEVANKIETRANVFALCLLMPIDRLKSVWVKSNGDIETTANLFVVRKIDLLKMIEFLGWIRD